MQITDNANLLPRWILQNHSEQAAQKDNGL